MATATNAATDFPNVVTQDMVDNNRMVTHLTLWREAARTNHMGTLDITDSMEGALGQTVTIPAGVISFTVPTPTNGTAYTARQGVEGMHGDHVYVDAHHGAPGGNNTANRLDDLGMADLASWTYS